MSTKRRPDDLEWVMHEPGDTILGWRVWFALRNRKTKQLSLRSLFSADIIWEPAVSRDGDFYVAEICLADRFVYKSKPDGTIHQMQWSLLGEVFARRFDRIRQPCTEMIPGAHCGCGYNAFLTREDALSYQKRKVQPIQHAAKHGPISGILIGEVELAGEVVEHNDHVRASHCKILSLEMRYGKQSVADELSLLYDVRVTRNVKSHHFGFRRQSQ